MAQAGSGTRLSRSKIELFGECPRCFFRDQRLGVARPRTPPFKLNNAVDHLLKREFDAYRVDRRPHPLMVHHGVKAIPFQDARLSEWRRGPSGGISAVHGATGFEVFGVIDDVWVSPEGRLLLVDYKASAPDPDKPRWPAKVRPQWKRQIEVYQWLFRHNGFEVEDQAYFVHAMGDIDAAVFDGKLAFELQLLSCDGSDAWLEPELHKIRAVLSGTALPPAGPGWDGSGCAWCAFV